MSIVAATAAAQSGPTTYAYDARGNVTSKFENGAFWTYIYDARNLLQEVARRRDRIVQLRQSRPPDKEGRFRECVCLGTTGFSRTDDAGNTIAKYEYAIAFLRRVDCRGALYSSMALVRR
jgi:YD repeat-containing protein